MRGQKWDTGACADCNNGEMLVLLLYKTENMMERADGDVARK